MEVKATAKTLRIPPRKARIVIDLIRGKDAAEAAAILKFTPNVAAEAVGKVLKSAVSNAVNNHDMDEEKLYVKACYANEGVTLKRFMPRAKGSASAIHKRTSHITVVVDERDSGGSSWDRKLVRSDYVSVSSVTGSPDGTLTRIMPIYY